MARNGARPQAPARSTVTPEARSDAARDAGRRRRLRRLCGPRGVIAGIAIDHRDSLLAMLERRGLSLGRAELQSLKLVLARVLAPGASAIMLDDEYGHTALVEGAVPPWVGLIMPLEAQGYEAMGDGRTTTLLDAFSPMDALRHGADACKLLVPYRVDDERSAVRQDAVVTSTIAACHDAGLPLVIEPVVYRWSSESPAAYADAYPGLVTGAVARLQPLGMDLLKLPFPVRDLAASGEPAALDACQVLARACRDTPWVLLGGGEDADTFVDQIRLAGSAGAAGFLAGRGLWGPALAADPREIERLASTVCRPSFERCRQIAELAATPMAAASGG